MFISYYLWFYETDLLSWWLFNSASLSPICHFLHLSYLPRFSWSLTAPWKGFLNHHCSSVIWCREWLICCSIVAAAFYLKMEFHGYASGSSYLSLIFMNWCTASTLCVICLTCNFYNCGSFYCLSSLNTSIVASLICLCWYSGSVSYCSVSIVEIGMSSIQFLWFLLA
jgi:hypothetical protein